MNEQIQMHIVALNAVILRSASTMGERLDPATADALNRDYTNAWEGLEACGITEWMLVYDPETMTFSLGTAGEQANNLLATMPLPAVINQTVRSLRHTDDLDTDSIPFI